MRHDWIDPFSVDRMLRRVGGSVLVGVTGVAVCVGVPLSTYQSLKAQLQIAPPSVPQWHVQTDRLSEKLGASAMVTATSNGWVVTGKDPDAWVRQLGSAPPEFLLNTIRLELVHDHYVLTMVTREGPDVLAK